MSRRIAFIRHGAYHQKPDTPSALQPFPLTDQGTEEVHRQAKAFTDWCRDSDQTLAPTLQVSPLLRAWQTAAVFAEALELEMHATDALCERSVGALANLSIDEIETVLAVDPRHQAPPENWKSDSHYCLPVVGAESLLQAGRRVADHVLATAQPNQLTLYVGHGASIRHAAFHLGLLAFDDIARLSMHHAQPVVLDLDGDGSPIWGHWKTRHAREALD